MVTNAAGSSEAQLRTDHWIGLRGGQRCLTRAVLVEPWGIMSNVKRELRSKNSGRERASAGAVGTRYCQSLSAFEGVTLGHHDFWNVAVGLLVWLKCGWRTWELRRLNHHEGQSRRALRADTDGAQGDSHHGGTNAEASKTRHVLSPDRGLSVRATLYPEGSFRGLLNRTPNARRPRSCPPSPDGTYEGQNSCLAFSGFTKKNKCVQSCRLCHAIPQ